LIAMFRQSTASAARTRIGEPELAFDRLLRDAA
jgi:hypothetical protein